MPDELYDHFQLVVIELRPQLSHPLGQRLEERAELFQVLIDRLDNHAAPVDFVRTAADISDAFQAVD